MMFSLLGSADFVFPLHVCTEEKEHSKLDQGHIQFTGFDLCRVVHCSSAEQVILERLGLLE